MKKENSIWSIPFILGIGIFYIVPILVAIYYSLFDQKNNAFLGLSAYRNLLINPAFKLALKNTLKFYCLGIPLIICLPFILAIVSVSQKNARSINKAIIFSMIVPTATMMLYVNIIFGESGFLNSLTNISKNISFWLLILLFVYKYGGYNYLIFRVSLSKIDIHLLEEAKVCGASNLQCYRYIIIPEIVPSVFLSMFVSFFNSYKIYREAYYIGGYYPESNIYLFQHFINNNYTHLNFNVLLSFCGDFCFCFDRICYSKKDILHLHKV